MLPNWGMLEKSQVDDQTVDEAVAAAITAHLDDEAAHVGVGQSLQSHAASVIIDHLASSIVEDKLASGCVTTNKITSNQIIGKDLRTATDVGSGVDGVKMTADGIEMWQGGERKVNIPRTGDALLAGDVKVNSLAYLKFTLQSWFESLDGWNITADIFSYLGYLEISTPSTINTIRDAFVPTDDQFSIAPNQTKDMIFEAVAAVAGTTAIDGRIGIGNLEDDNGVGFRLTKTKVYRLYFDFENVEHTVELTGLDPQVLHTYRVVVTDQESVEWYVDGVLLSTLVWPGTDPLLGSAKIIHFWLKNTEEGVVKLLAYRALYQQNF